MNYFYILKQPGDNNFIGNKLIIEGETNVDTFKITVSVGDKSAPLTLVPYQVADYHLYPNRVRADISDIVSSLIDGLTPVVDGSSAIVSIDNFAFDVQVGFSAVAGLIFFKAFRGGITSKAARYLSDFGTDIFSYRLNNTTRNFLFTTRTNGNHLVLKETELFPFFFIHSGRVISFVADGQTITPPTLAADTTCAMDIEAVRALFTTPPSFIEVKVDGITSFDITINPAKISEDRCQLLFKNSMGAFEVIDVTGRRYDAPAFADEHLYNTFSEDNVFEENRDRLSVRRKIEAETGYKTKDELTFILDMVASDEIYLIDGEDEIRCHVTVDQIKIAQRMTEPNSIPLVIRTTTDEDFHTPTISIPKITVFGTEDGAVLGTEDLEGMYFENN